MIAQGFISSQHDTAVLAPAKAQQVLDPILLEFQRNIGRVHPRFHQCTAIQLQCIFCQPWLQEAAHFTFPIVE